MQWMSPFTATRDGNAAFAKFFIGNKFKKKFLLFFALYNNIFLTELLKILSSISAYFFSIVTFSNGE